MFSDSIKAENWTGPLNPNLFNMVAEGFHEEDEGAAEAQKLGEVLENVACTPPIAREGITLSLPSVPVEHPQFICRCDGVQIGTVIELAGTGLILPGRPPQTKWKFYGLSSNEVTSSRHLHDLIPLIDKWLDDQQEPA
jgi:hypothetical protein